MLDTAVYYNYNKVCFLSNIPQIIQAVDQVEGVRTRRIGISNREFAFTIIEDGNILVFDIEYQRSSRIRQVLPSPNNRQIGLTTIPYGLHNSARSLVEDVVVGKCGH